MSTTVTAVWRPPPGAYGPRSHRRPGEYRAYIPDEVCGRDLGLPSGVSADASDAERALVAVDRSPRAGRLASLARFLLRAEAIASSRIEGLEVSSGRLARHAAKAAAGIHDPDRTADAVLGNVAAMRLAVDEMANRESLSIRDVTDLHDRLMHDDAPALAGVVRKRQNWIGGSDWSPCRAAFVPPPPDRVPALLDDLCRFVSGDDAPPLVQAAVVHAQFETIRPFADGNGRAGRALIHGVLRRRGLVATVVPPISPVLARHTSGYAAGLTAYRYTGPPDSAEARAGLARWVEVFASAARGAASDAMVLVERLEELEEGWAQRAHPRRGSTAARLLPELAAAPVVSATDVQRLTGAGRSAAFTALEQLVGAGVLHQVGTGHRDRLFEAREVFQVLTDHERAAAATSGDTHQRQ